MDSLGGNDLDLRRLSHFEAGHRLHALRSKAALIPASSFQTSKVKGLNCSHCYGIVGSLGDFATVMLKISRDGDQKLVMAGKVRMNEGRRVSEEAPIGPLQCSQTNNLR